MCNVKISMSVVLLLTEDVFKLADVSPLMLDLQVAPGPPAAYGTSCMETAYSCLMYLLKF